MGKGGEGEQNSGGLDAGGALSGAASGAAAGSVVPGWGTLIGAIVGGIAGSGAVDSVLSTNGKVGKTITTGLGVASGAAGAAGAAGGIAGAAKATGAGAAASGAGGMQGIAGAGANLGAATSGGSGALNAANVLGSGSSGGAAGLAEIGQGVGASQAGAGVGSSLGLGLNDAITGAKSTGTTMDKLNRLIEMKDQVGSLLGRSEENPNPQVLMQDMNINPTQAIQGVPGMNQVIAAQLMNPAQNQNRLAFRRFA